MIFGKLGGNVESGITLTLCWRNANTQIVPLPDVIWFQMVLPFADRKWKKHFGTKIMPTIPPGISNFDNKLFLKPF